MDLLTPIVPSHKLNKIFIALMESKGFAPAREMIKEITKDMSDTDGNFVEQFQTTGLDARIFELYLHTYFKFNDFVIDTSQDRPDFLLEKDGIEFAVEATTSNPSPHREPLIPNNKEIFELSSEEVKTIQKRLFDELPVRLGGPLYNKIRKEYWKLEHCKEKPFLLAIEAFHDKGAIFLSDAPLSDYLYGMKHYPIWSEDGRLIVQAEKVETHSTQEKVIPSNFFQQPNAEYISAVIFSNSGTIPKFNRMGYQEGYKTDNIKLMRQGTYYNHDPNASMPLPFVHDLDEILEERGGKAPWGEGLTIFHNPYAQFPLPFGLFPDACEVNLENGYIVGYVPKFHPYVSMTHIINIVD